MNAVAFGGNGGGKKPRKHFNKKDSGSAQPEQQTQSKSEKNKKEVKKEHRTDAIYQQILHLLRTPDSEGNRQLTLQEVDGFAKFLQGAAKSTLNKAAGEQFDANMKSMLKQKKEEDTKGDQVEDEKKDDKAHRPFGADHE